VYLFERIDAVREPLKYLKCVTFVRPTPENIRLLAAELHAPRYAQYYIYFSNVISKTDVKTLAEADEHECVREMNEFYCDFVALLPHLFTLNMPRCYQSLSLAPDALHRCVQALTGVLLSLKRASVVIRYETASPGECVCMCATGMHVVAAARALAEGVRNMMNKESALFDTRKHAATTEPLLLVVLDRRNDCVSPLLSQWTYQVCSVV
jgi:vacuolar protein sorting-associated protein 45